MTSTDNHNETPRIRSAIITTAYEILTSGGGAEKTNTFLATQLHAIGELSEEEAATAQQHSDFFRPYVDEYLATRAKTDLLVGALWLGGSLAATIAGYVMAAPGGTYAVFGGAIVFGIYKIIQGLNKPDL